MAKPTINFGKVGQNCGKKRDYFNLHEPILFGFLGNSNDAISINYSNCILYEKHFIYREKLNNQH